MYTNERPTIPEFPPDEPVYMRYSGLTWEADGQLANVFRLKYPAEVDKSSFNRGSLSQPEDLLYADDNSYRTKGVLGIIVDEIPKSVSAVGGGTFNFWPAHVPDGDNYSHSEIWCIREGEPDTLNSPNKPIRTAFRIMLAHSLTEDRICIRAEK